MSTHSINSKRSSSNIDASQFEPSIKKSSCVSSSESQIPAPHRVSSGSKKMFSRAPMGDFFAKCGLISRNQQIYEDFFIQEDKIDYLSYLKTTQIVEKASFSLNCIEYGSDMSVQAKCLSSFCLNESEQNSSNKNEQQQQLLLETRAREESSEYSINCDEEDQIEGGLKCNFLTDQIEPSGQIIIQGCESAQPMLREEQFLKQGHDFEYDQQNNYTEEDYANLQENQEIKVIEIVQYD